MPRTRKTPQEQLAELQARKAQIAAQEADLKTRVRSEERKRDTRRKIVAGAAVLEHANHDPQFAEMLEHVLNRAVTREGDRELLGLDQRGEGNASVDFPQAVSG